MSRFGVILLCLAGFLSGCGGGEATVTGTLTWKTAPLNSGTITFINSGGTGNSFPIKTDGTYAAKGLAPGKYKVAISTPNMAAPVVGPPPVPGKKGGVEKGAPPVQVDAKYAKAETSSLEYTLAVGSQVINIDLPK